MRWLETPNTSPAFGIATDSSPMKSRLGPSLPISEPILLELRRCPRPGPQSGVVDRRAVEILEARVEDVGLQPLGGELEGVVLHAVAGDAEHQPRLRDRHGQLADEVALGAQLADIGTNPPGTPAMPPARSTVGGCRSAGRRNP